MTPGALHAGVVAIKGFACAGAGSRRPLTMPENAQPDLTPTKRTPRPGEKASMEALMHGIFAITMTLLILELRVPESETDGHLWDSLLELGPHIAGYLFGFVYLMAVWLSLRDFFRQLSGITSAVSVVILVVIGTVSLTPFTVSTMASAGGTDDLGVAVRLMASVVAASFLLASVAAKLALRQGLVPATAWFTMPWPRVVLVAVGPATLGFALSYLNPWLGIGVLSLDIVLGIINPTGPPDIETAPQEADLPVVS
jgi:uncharacterized membrane protein